MDGPTVDEPHEMQFKFPLIVGAALLLLAGLFYWYQVALKKPPQEAVQPPAGASITTPDLGSELYEKSRNPIEGSLPETLAPVPNPLEGVYKNPFE